jgi:hypothetical protein
MLEAFITVLFTSPLPVALVILGVLCVVAAIIGKLPSIQLNGFRAFALGSFGVILILGAVVSAWLLAIATQPQGSIPLPTPNVETSPSSTPAATMTTAFLPSPTQAATATQKVQPVTQPTATSQQILQQPTATTPPSSRVLLGLWEWQGNRPPMPTPAGPGQVIFANGDIDNSGACHVKEFGSGQLVQGLGEGRFQLWLITGTPEQIAAHEGVIQQGSASDPNNPFGTCPYLP